ncbi:MAG TPA: hypothetical protein VF989_19040 [Polyangiaceae bacterium]
MSAPELSQSDYEALELDAIEARQSFLEALAGSPVVAKAYMEWQSAERHAFEGRRARRESEVHHGS